ncbi:hypothetical protein F4777DRAFT_597558 [Nemania sp. FL0916]|nr:hypothetical protein F4777DRAFT_597558 [Nemania sp. FL0916]
MPDHRPQSPPRRPRACLPCTKAKARCQYENNELGDGCNRCLRLSISCTPQTTKSLRRPRQVKAKNAFPRPNHVYWISNIISKAVGPLEGANGTSNNGRTVGSQDGSEQYDIAYHSRPLPSRVTTSSALPLGPGFGINWDQAERAVGEFTTIFTAHFPFIILDHDITARQLFVEKPLLFRAILMISMDFSCAKSLEIRRSVDAWIGQHLLVMEQQSIGTLQGLIVYIAWANPHFYSDQRVTQLIYLAVGLAHSLGITRRTVSGDTNVKKETEINEEHRAFLACYYLLSFNSFQFGRPNPLSSSYVDYCVDSLEHSSEFPTDFLLIKLVRFRQFIGRVPNVYEGLCDLKWCRDISADTSDQLHELKRGLDDSMSDIAHKHPKFLLLWSLHHNALVQLYLPMTYIIPDREGDLKLQLESMKYCLQASRTFVSMVRSFSPDGFLYAPFTTLTDTISMLIAASRLLLIEIDGWDLKEARQSIDLKAGIDEALAKLETASDIKAKRVTASAAENPSSYTSDGPDEERHDRLRVFMKLFGIIRKWLDGQGVFLSGEENPDIGDNVNEVRASTRFHVSPESPQWNFTFFFESLLQVNPTSTL